MRSSVSLSVCLSLSLSLYLVGVVQGEYAAITPTATSIVTITAIVIPMGSPVLLQPLRVWPHSMS